MAIPKINYANIDLISPYTNKKLTFRPILVRDIEEELNIEELDTVKQIRYICNILKRCIIGETNDLNNLYYFEVIWFYLKLKAFSDTAIIPVTMQCEIHNIAYNTTIDINDVRIPENKTFKKEIELSNGYTLWLEYYKYKDICYLTEEINKIVNYTMIKGCVIDGEFNDWQDETVEEKQEFMNSLKASDLNHFNQFILEMPLPYLAHKHNCKECKTDEESYIYNINNFFV
jgi:hypothetical protein